MSLPKEHLSFIRAARVAHLATADAAAQPHVVPICFIFDGHRFYTPIDEKPKRAEPSKLKRVRNIRENSQVALVIDHYEDNWEKLAYLLISGKARVLLAGPQHQRSVRLLRRKYPQYRSMQIDKRPLLVITPKRMTSWTAASRR